ncbi:peptidoglycan-binding protein [Shewanella sairae]|uniref:Peptidoglycan-binding protein n=1 Tax=Shewanella sairae TaxID=190310 RepID=A0ABQ4PQ26_9GAMM|nr:L,D-transpeptidase family protein [Shewanella sairae]MCL1130062.1 L,D-transpeptidase family protein [Shewanella sairae]GIU50908.1 peptidoglycan-binding protein [Shewanella sairae]
MRLCSHLCCLMIFAGSFSIYADDRQLRAEKMLRQQLAIIVLVSDDERFIEHKKTLAAGTLTQKSLTAIELDIAQYWQDHQIPIRANTVQAEKDPFLRAMALEPQIEGFLQLQNRIRHLLWLSEQDWWQPISLEVLVRPGDKSQLIPVIVKRLWLLGDAKHTTSDSVILDDDVVIAIKRFQRRHGLTADGIIGPETVKWLNVSPQARARMLANNFVQRAEFMSQRSERFLVINIPAFEMELFNQGRVELASRVIVGKPYRPTPLLSSSISNVVINPSWRVPKKILYNDLLPQVRKDGHYINDRNFDVFDRQDKQVIRTAEQWSDLARGPFPYRFVQRPGINNTLGRYKFYFPNDHSVYLHDTVDPELFERSDRALSSGCIRVENVEGLANWMAAHLVKDKQTWVDRHRDRKRTQWFSLNSTLNVHLVYWTAWIDDANQVQFRNDIYQMNATNQLTAPASAQINDL